MRTEHDVNLAVERYADLVRRICFVRLKSREDAEDVFQNVFLKYLLHTGTFENEEHEKAWFARVTINACKDWLRSLTRRQTLSLEILEQEAAQIPEESHELLEALLTLPNKYKDVIYLHFYEGYSAVEIAKILNHKENTIYTWLARAKALLRNKLGGDLL